MTRFSIRLLGPFQATRDDQAVHVPSAKARALLACLAAEPDRPHTREALAEMLWPGRPEGAARANLRHTLAVLRKALGPPPGDGSPPEPLLWATRDTIQFNVEGGVWVDAATFAETSAAALSAACPNLAQLEAAIDVYHGPFLADLSLPDSATYEEWALVQREGYSRQALNVLRRLAEGYEQLGELGRGLVHARRQLELEPWDEDAQRQVMGLLALDGQRGAALAQYETCRRVLAQELGVEPEEETTALYNQIREGALAGAPVQKAALSPAITPERSEAPAPPPAAPEPVRVTDERRVLTVVHCTVSGSTDLLARLGSEEWASTMGQILRALAGEVFRYGGEVDRYGEAGLVACFGALRAHEDDPERAVLAALSMQAAFDAQVKELVAQQESIGGLSDLGLRVNVHTGEAIVTALQGDGRQSRGKAMGEAVADAGEMHAQTKAGEVWVSESTYRRVAPLFEWQADEEGSGRPHVTYCPVAQRESAGKGRGIEGLVSPLVGRDAEFHALQDAVDRLRSGIGGIVTLVGEAGIGKSRLVAEARGRERGSEGVSQWVEGRCLSYGEGVAYQLWLDWLRGLLNVALDASHALVRDALRRQVQSLCPDRADDVYPFLAQMMSLPLEADGTTRLRGLAAEGLQALTFRAAATLLECAAQQRPLAVVCEDLHWADPTSLELLAQLLPLTDRVPLLFVCVFRPRTEHGCWRIRERVARDYRHRHTDLWLKPLSPAESEVLVGNLLRVDDLPCGLRERVLAHGEGNPFYVEEILRSLIDVAAPGGAAIVYDEARGRWQAAKDVTEIAIPDTLHGVLAARIDGLPGEARRLLQLAAVIGRIFSYRVLDAIAEKRGLEDHLVTLQRAQMIRERARLPEVEYAFEHVLTQAAAYGGLLGRARRALHRRVAEVLERLYPERGSPGRGEGQLGLLAHHWERAGEPARAADYARRAGEQAAAQYANEEAIAYLSRALSLTPEEDLAGRYALLLARQGVYNVQAAREAQGRDLEALKQVAKRLAQRDDGRLSTRRLAVVALREAVYYSFVGDLSAKIAAARRAIRLAQAAQDPGLEACGYLEWGRGSEENYDVDSASPKFKQACILARSAGQRAVEADSLRELGLLSHNFRNDYAAASTYHVQALRLYRELGDRMGEGRALDSLGYACFGLGDCAAGMSYHEQGLSLCRETGNRYDEIWALWGLGFGSLLLGEPDRARAHYERLLRMPVEVGVAGARQLALLGLGSSFHLLGDYARARATYERALRTELEMQPVRGTGHAWLGLLFHHLGDDETARSHAQRAVLLTQETGCRDPQAQALTVLGHALAGLRRQTDATGAYQQALALRRDLGQSHLIPEPLAGLARLAEACGDRAGALAHVEEILCCLETYPELYGACEPLRVYLTCYRVLRAVDDPRAEKVLSRAYSLIQERVQKIEDEDMRRSYLENVAAHREIIAAWEERSHT